MEINSNHSTYGAAFRQKPIFFMSGKETVAFFEGKLKKNMTLQEDSCTLAAMTLIADSIPLMRFRTRRREVRFWIWIF